MITDSRFSLHSTWGGVSFALSYTFTITQEQKKICFSVPSMLSSKQMWQNDNVPASVSSLQTLQMFSSFRSMFSNCSSSSMIGLLQRKQKHKTKVKDSLCCDTLS